jgi:hypothetical protein
MVWDRFDSSRLIEETQEIYQMIHQKIMNPRDLGDSDVNVEKRDDFEACPMPRVDETHPLW